MSHQIELTERATLSLKRVDTERGILRGVRVLGAKSRNGRTYKESALRDAARLSNGCRVFLDHVGEAFGRSRGVRDLIGYLKAGRVSGNAVYADLQLLKSHPHASAVLEVAAAGHKGVGLSIHGKGVAKHDDNGEVFVEGLEALSSTDIVLEPATSSGFFSESLRKKPDQFDRQAATLLKEFEDAKFLAFMRGTPTPRLPDPEAEAFFSGKPAPKSAESAKFLNWLRS